MTVLRFFLLLVFVSSYFLPALLTTECPYVEDRSEKYKHELIRLYKMEFLSPGFFMRLISRILAGTRQEHHRDR